MIIKRIIIIILFLSVIGGILLYKQFTPLNTPYTLLSVPTMFGTVGRHTENKFFFPYMIFNNSGYKALEDKIVNHANNIFTDRGKGIYNYTKYYPNSAEEKVDEIIWSFYRDTSDIKDIELVSARKPAFIELKDYYIVLFRFKDDSTMEGIAYINQKTGEVEFLEMGINCAPKISVNKK